jgi:hypothetical protein
MGPRIVLGILLAVCLAARPRFSLGMPSARTERHCPASPTPGTIVGSLGALLGETHCVLERRDARRQLLQKQGRSRSAKDLDGIPTLMSDQYTRKQTVGPTMRSSREGICPTSPCLPNPATTSICRQPCSLHRPLFLSCRRRCT